MTLLTAVPYWLALTVVKKWTDRLPADERGNYRRYDNVGKVWSKVWLALTNSYPHIVGTDKLKAVQGPCLIVANHASWLDIPVLCTVLDGEFKFIAKGELVKVPLIGKQVSRLRVALASILPLLFLFKLGFSPSCCCSSLLSSPILCSLSLSLSLSLS